MVDLNEDIIKEYLNVTGLSVMSLITIAMTEQPDIITNFEVINKMDATILQTKVKEFMNNNTVFDDPYNVAMTVFLSNLMYKNDVIPELVKDILLKLDVTDITLEELKQNSKSLIDTLTSSVKSGGGWFSVITNLVSIGTILFTVVLDYSFIQHNIPVFKEAYSDTLSIYERVTEARQSYEECGNIPIPATVDMLDKLLVMVDKNIGQNNYTTIYRIVICISNGHLNKYLKEKPEFITTDISAFSAKFSETTSRELIPYGVSTVDNSYSKELVVLGSYLDSVDNMLGSIIVYQGDDDKPVINIEESLTNLKHYAQMPPEELSRMLKTQVEAQQKSKIVKTEPTSLKGIISSIFSATTADMINLGNSLIQQVLEVGPVPAVNIIDSYIFMIQDFCEKKVIELEDFQRESQRNLSRFLKNVYRKIQNIREFFKMLKFLLWINGVTGGIILNYCRIIFVKFQALRRGQENATEVIGREVAPATPSASRQIRHRNIDKQNILSLNTGTGMTTRKASTTAAIKSAEDAEDAEAAEAAEILMRMRNTPVEEEKRTINDIDGGKKRKTLRNKKHRTKRVKRSKRRNTRHRKNRFTKRR